MYVFVRKSDRQILDASDIRPWATYLDPDTQEIVEVPGEENTYVWPNGDRVRCICTTAGEILGNPAWVDVDDLRDAYVAAKAAITTMAANTAIPADARNAVVKLGQCVEELLKFLKRRIA